MRTICLAGTLLIAISVLAQDGKPPILLSHNRIDGPFGGQYRVEDLQVFSSGRVLYVEEGTTTLGQQPTHASHEVQMEANEMQQLVRLLNSPGVRSLPKKIASKTKPIDFFWQASLEINYSNGAQRIRVENFYPFLNLHGHTYPQALIDLECTVQSIQVKTAKRQQPGDEDNWCKKLATTPNRVVDVIRRFHELQVDCRIVCDEERHCVRSSGSGTSWACLVRAFQSRRGATRSCLPCSHCAV